MIVRRALPGGGWEPATVPTLAEMVRMACAEVGVNACWIVDRPSEDGSGPTVGVVGSKDSYSPDEWQVILKAGSLVVFRMYGANRPVRCGYHAGRYDCTRCGGVLSGELLVNPNADCGRR